MHIDFPYSFDKLGRTAEADDAGHIKDLIEQVLFTAPGERVNRPGFGSGLLQSVFQPNSDEMASANQFLIQGGLQQWLGDLIEVNTVDVQNQDASLYIKIIYTVRRTRETQQVQFIR